MNNPFSLENKVILVTGASSGIGKATAIECSKLGAKLIIVARNQSRLAATYQLLEGQGHIQIKADLTIDSEIKLVLDSIPAIDGLVNVAGIANTLPFQFITRSEIDKLMNINFSGNVLLSSFLVKNKKFNRNGSVIFISSISGVKSASMGGSLYGASKAALNGLVKSMALELSRKKIRVNSILPGMVDTIFFSDSAITEEQLIEDRKKYPLGRHGKPEDVAYAAIYLLSDASSWMTGSELLLDGGYTLI